MSNSKTVVGLFENESDAQTATQKLASIGISRDMVDISRGSKESFDQNSNDEGDNGVTRFFKNLFGDDNDDADRYSSISSKGYSIVTVHAQTSDQAEQAADILDDCGAVDVDEKASQNGFASRSGNTERSDFGDKEEKTINRTEENLEIGKRTEDRGGVRVRSRIVEKPVEETIRLREEHVNVERNKVDRPVTDSDNAFKDQDIELTESAERAVVNKQARVVEEIKISKDVTDRNETIHETLRNTEVDVENLDKNRNENDDQYRTR